MDKENFLESLFDNLTVEIITGDLTQCTMNWREYNYTPTCSKIHFILKGEGRLVIDGVEYFPKPKQISIMPANIEQSYEVINNNPYYKYWTHFNLVSGGRSIFDVIKVPYLVELSESSYESLKVLFRGMTSHIKNKRLTSNLMLESYIREIFAIYIEEAGIERIEIIESKDGDRQRKILEYIDRNIGKNITVEELAHDLYLHPNYFSVYFKKLFGVSPTKFINKRKLDLSCKLLHSGNLSITEISTLTGFKDIYHFSKAFKKYTGFSPKYYRNHTK